MNTDRVKERTRQTVIALRAKRALAEGIDIVPLDDVILNKILELREEYDMMLTELIVRECAKLVDEKLNFENSMGLTIGRMATTF